METLSMTARERRRLTEFSRVQDGLISVAEAARSLGLSERQGRRLWKAYREKGDAGLIHGLRGKPSNFGQGVLRGTALALYRRKYQGCNAAHAADLLAAQDQVAVPRQTLWRWLKAEDLIVQARRCRPHRCRRQRRACVGELLQMDGSTHAWLGAAYPPCVLFVMIDDASSQVFARFYLSEDTAAAFDLFGQYVRRHGVPEALYVDHDSIYVVNDEEAQERCRQAGRKEPRTQFGRAMDELAVTIIAANSPQAKGRVERVNRTLQDRLVKELALALDGQGLHEIAAANAFLEQGFLRAFNRRFSQPPAGGLNRHRRVPPGVHLEDVLCQKETRTVGQDWCVSFETRLLQIDPKHQARQLAGKKIEVFQRADGRLKLMHKSQPLRFREVATRPVQTAVKPRPAVLAKPWRPGPEHPWKRGLATGSPAKSRRGQGRSIPGSLATLDSPPFHGLDLAPQNVTILLRR